MIFAYYRGKHGKGYYRNAGSERLHLEKNSDPLRGPLKSRAPASLFIDTMDASFPGTGMRISTSRDSPHEETDFSVPGSLDVAVPSSESSQASPREGVSQNAVSDI